MPPRKYAKPLNPQLYNFLWAISNGTVRVTKHGQKFRYNVKTIDGHTTVFTVPGGGGEQYSICCPMCKDDRFRFYISHAFGTEIHGVEITNVVNCFNENCRGLSKWLQDNMFAYYHDLGGTYITQAAEEVEEDWDIEKVMAEMVHGHERLKGIQLLTSLAPDHPAIVYVKGRGFDPKYLAETFCVGYYRGTRKGIRNQRLVAPVFYKQQQIGWNARVIDGHTPLTPDPGRGGKSWPYREGKYVNALGYQKSLTLYNRDLAAGFDVIGVVEGVTDVWAAGEWCVGIMGKNMSQAQIQQLCDISEARKAWIVLFGDGNSYHPSGQLKDDASSAWQYNYEAILDRYKYPTRVRLHLFAPGDDPGGHTRAELEELATRILHEPQSRTDS